MDDPRHATLRDGSKVLIRPVEPDDKQGLSEAFERLSEESRYRRFLTSQPRLTKTQLRYLTEVDHRDHEALVALGGDEMPAGVARYVRTEPDSDRAEVAVVVMDDWQRRGVATVLLERLAARAREEGIDHFTATALAQNHAVIDLLEELGPARVAPSGSGTVEMTIDLPARADADSPLLGALRRAAEGALSVLGERSPLGRR